MKGPVAELDASGRIPPFGSVVTPCKDSPRFLIPWAEVDVQVKNPVGVISYKTRHGFAVAGFLNIWPLLLLGF